MNRPSRRTATRRAAVAATAVLVCFAGGATAPVASAFQALRVDTISNTTAQPGEIYDLRIQVGNEGSTPLTDDPVEVRVDLPAGLAVADPAGEASDPASYHWAGNRGNGFSYGFGTVDFGFGLTPCTGEDGITPLEGGETVVRCSNVGPFAKQPVTGWSLIHLPVDVAPDAEPGDVLTTEIAASGGGAAPVGAVDQTRVAVAEPGFGLDDFDGLVTDPEGDAYTQAAGTPFEASGRFSLNTRQGPTLEHGAVYPAEAAKDIVVDLPRGLVGDLSEVPECVPAQLVHAPGGFASQPLCPVASQVGTVQIEQAGQLPYAVRALGLYNMVPPPGVPARLGFAVLGSTVLLEATVRSGGDYGLAIASKKIPAALATTGTEVTVWGVPADPAHDFERSCASPTHAPLTDGGPSAADPACVDGDGEPLYDRPAQTALLRNPTSCPSGGEGLVTTAHGDSWANPGGLTADGAPNLADPAWTSRSFTSHEAPGFGPYSPGETVSITGCDAVPFNPQLSVATTSGSAATPSGLGFELSLPQTSDPANLGSSDLKDITVRLPEGYVVNPSSADGLAACSLAQVDLDGNNTEARCPKGSKLGTVEVETPLLDEPLTGGVYLAAPDDPSRAGAENPFDALVALYVIVKAKGVIVKLPGKVALDQATGRLTARFENQPQLPFSKLALRMFDGPRASLTTPTRCGARATVSELAPWARPDSTVKRSSLQTVTSGCESADSFDPGFSAGTDLPVAGGFSPLALRVTRSIGKELGRIDTTLPGGLLADLSDVPVCPESALALATGRSGKAVQATPACPASQVGTVTVGAGSGPSPFYPRIPGRGSSGRVFLTGAHSASDLTVPGAQQAAYGLAVEVPAVAGPFDLGNVLVRAAIFVDRETARITVRSDKLPRILDGIPLALRDVRVRIDRDQFTVNPTNCDPMEVQGDIRAQDGTAVSRSTRFQVDGCSTLELSPKLAMRLVGKRQMRSGGNPALRVKLTQPAGQANIERVRVALPKNLILDPERSVDKKILCPYERGLEADCPASSAIGNATAVSPLLKRPLRGTVYFVQGKRRDPRTGNLIRTLPALLVKLRGEVALNLRATSNVEGGRLISTFPVVPDARVSSFRLNLKGGDRKGILSVARTRDRTLSLCERVQRTLLSIRGHNGRLDKETVSLRTPCAERKPRQRLELRRRQR